MKQLSLPFILLFLCLSCNDNSNKAYSSLSEPESAVEETINGPLTRPSPIVEKETDVLQQNKKIIKDGRMGLQVTDLEKTKQNIDAALKQYGGYYANESYQDSHYQNTFTLNIRIPSTGYEKFISDIQNGNGKVLYKEISARDVTDQFVDIQTRLANKRSYLNRYRELVRQAKTIKEVLEVEEQIRILEEEIESAEGRLRLMNDRVSYSTLELTLNKEKEYTYTPDKRIRFFERAKEAFSSGWHIFVDIILVLFTIWPLWIVMGVVIYVIRRKRKNKKQ